MDDTGERIRELEEPGVLSATVPIPPGGSHQRLWTPWRMRYVTGTTRENGCVFCNRFSEEDDVEGLILHRGTRAFIVMNLYPYNTGHVMIVPIGHIASPEDADPETIAEMAALRPPLLRALRRTLSPEGFNLGINLGAVAGAGIAEHLHEHVVPRWQGDANFMPILASTTVMPEVLPVTYAKIRGELNRETTSDDVVSLLLISGSPSAVLLDGTGELPVAIAEEGEPLWRAAVRAARAKSGVDVELLGWGGERRAGRSPSVLFMRTTSSPEGQVPGPAQFTPVGNLAPGPLATFVQGALSSGPETS
jgi:ATP adenylyltransferase